MKKLLLVFFFSLLTNGSSWAVELDGTSTEILLDKELIYAEDVESSWNLDEAISQLQRNGEKWLKGGSPNFGLTVSSYWVKVELSSDFSSDTVWLLKLDYPLLDRIDFYFKDRTGNWIHKTAGDTIAFNSRDLNSHSIFFSFPVLTGLTQDLYFRFESQGSVQLPLSLMSFDEERKQDQIQGLGFGFYFGIVLAMVLYNFYIWVSTRDRSYLYYILFVASQGLFHLISNGLSFQYFWPQSPQWAQYSMLLAISATVGFALLFARSFMDVSRYDIRAANVFTVMATTALLLAVSVFLLDYNFLAKLMAAFALISVAWITWISIWIALQGYKPAKFFVVAWLLVIYGVVTEVFQRLGFNIQSLLFQSSISIGAIFEILILSLGLGERLNNLTTEKEKAQRELLIANQLTIDTLQQADQVKDEFIANVSHELRTPLTGIIGLSEIILEDKKGVLGVNDDLNLKMIRASGERLSSLVNDVIDLSSLKENQLRLNKRIINLNSICAVVVRMSQPLIGTKPIQLSETYPPEPIMVEADENRLQQILFNLIANAIKFTNRGWVSVSVEVLDLDARVVVKDTGIGISNAQQSQIFNRFYQVDSAESRKEGGAGLGLSISQKLVELHGTEIILRSKLGSGSTFYFDLPLLTDAQVDIDTEAVESEVGDTSNTSEKARGQISSSTILEGYGQSSNENTTNTSEQQLTTEDSNRTILLVDDEYLNLHVVTGQLEDSYHILTALNGHEALEIINNKKPDLVILDLMMPVMTGFELCEIIRKQYSLDELPVIILTAKNRVEDLVKGLNLGANDYISKPFTKEELRVRVGKQIELIDMLEVKKENHQLAWQLQKYRDAELKLREKDVRLIDLLDITGEAFLSTDDRGEIVSINEEFVRLFEIDRADFIGESINSLSSRFDQISPQVVEFLKYPFDEKSISHIERSHANQPLIDQPQIEQSHAEQSQEQTFEFEFPHLDGGYNQSVTMRICILPLVLGHEFFLVVFDKLASEEPEAKSGLETQDSCGNEQAGKRTMSDLVNELNGNSERAILITEYLQQLSDEELREHQYFFKDKVEVDKLIKSKNSTSDMNDADSWEQDYRHALVKLMQDCHHYWQKVTGKSIIDLAEKSRIWSVSIDNGRLRTRAMNRYLDIDKLPKNPRWRQVARTAFFVLSHVSEDVEAKKGLEHSVARLQDIVEQRALN